MLKLNTIKAPKQASKKRVGRGNASSGTYSGRGMKGQKSRSGGKGGLKRKGAMQTIRRLPKTRGFKSNRPAMAVVNVGDLNTIEKKIVDAKALLEAGLIKTARFGVKVLGSGKLEKALTVKVHAVSESAKKAIEAAGGKVSLIESKRKTGRHPKTGEKITGSAKEVKSIEK